MRSSCARNEVYLDGMELGIRVGQLYLDGEELIVADPALGLLHCRCRRRMLVVGSGPSATGSGWGLVCKDCGRWTEGHQSLESAVWDKGSPREVLF